MDVQKVTLEKVLAARERRAAAQDRLLQAYGVPLVSFSLNIAGPVKDTPLLRRAFAWGRMQLEAGLRAGRLPVLRREEHIAVTGCEGLYAVRGPAEELKALCVSIEEETPLGRLFDLDVLDCDGRKLERETERSCIVCGAPGRGCASRRTHSVEELQAATRRILEDHFRSWDRREAAELVTRALLEEVCTTPKPGLVDRNNTGAHRDMDLVTFMASCAALSPYWEECIRIGQDTAAVPPAETFRLLRRAGQAAERHMLEATGGVNSHKGAIFTLGALCGALGRLWSAREPCRDPGRIAGLCGVMCAEAVTADWAALSSRPPRTAGERLYLERGQTGIRGEAAAGLPSVLETALPTLERYLREGKSRNDAGSLTLLHLIALGRDSNLEARGGHQAAQQAAEEAAHLLEREPSMAEISALDRAFIEQNLSPGGCADLLAAAWFLFDWRERGRQYELNNEDGGD